MDSWKFVLIVIALILSDYSFAKIESSAKENALSKSIDEALKYVAKDETLTFLDELRIFGVDYGTKWLVMADGNGTSQIASLRKQRSGNEKFFIPAPTLEDTYKHVKLFLYTKNAPEGERLDPKDLKSSNFDPNKKTKIITHGWMASSNSSVIKGIRDAYLQAQEVNVIGVDWSRYANDIFYTNSVAATVPVGQFVGEMINSFVQETNTSYDSFHLIGHSLGAHVSGFAGNYTEGKIARITGLDPALPGFQYINGVGGSLDTSDADFVDVIHTCAGVLGMSNLVGHVDFFPNGGTPFQPGCCMDNFPPNTQACSHSRSHQFFAESIKNSEFLAVSCPDWMSFKQGNCSTETEKMGEFVSKTARGPYYLKTDRSSPFALGENGIFY